MAKIIINLHTSTDPFSNIVLHNLKNVEKTWKPTFHALNPCQRSFLSGQFVYKIQEHTEDIGNKSVYTKSYTPETFEVSILPKNSQLFTTNRKILAILEFSRHIGYNFLKEDHTNNFHTSIRKIHSSVWKLEVKNPQNCQF